MSGYQKGNTNLDFTEARDGEWQWHQLGYMQVCTSLQADNHASTPPLTTYACVAKHAQTTPSTVTTAPPPTSTNTSAAAASHNTASQSTPVAHQKRSQSTVTDKLTEKNYDCKWQQKMQTKETADHSRVGFISDSSFKFLFEDRNSTLKYVTQHNQAAPRIYCSMVDLAEDNYYSWR